MMTTYHKRFSEQVLQLRQRLGRLISSLSQCVIPYHCYFCDDNTKRGSWICDGCYADLPWNVFHCEHCALPVDSPFPDLLCQKCLNSPPSFNLAICAFRYETPVDSAIQMLKYHQKRYFAHILADMLADVVIKRYIKTSYPDTLIAVPIHLRKRKQRGFNQSQLIANRLSTILNIPADHHMLLKTKATPSQAGLNKLQRMRNLHGSFSLQKPLTGKHVALIDDVMTTLATTELLSRMLMQAGAKRVDIWCLARTAKQQ